VYGKIIEINKVDFGSAANNIDRVKKITYSYDAGGNRISKKVEKYTSGSAIDYTWYVRDASGNVMGTYNYSIVGTDLTTASLLQDEVYLYGSSRLGSLKLNRNVELTKQIWDTTYTLGLGLGIAVKSPFTRGIKQYELSNHLQNVLVTISDKKIGVDANTDGIIDYYNADVITANDYYPFGMIMPARKYQQGANSYRYSINGQERESELNENLTTALYWEFDSRIGRRWNVDPVLNISESRYACLGDNPNYYSDPLGDFKSEGSAKWYRFLHGGSVRKVNDGAGRHGGEWYVSKNINNAGGSDGSVTVGVKVAYDWGVKKAVDNNIINPVNGWWNSVEFTSQTNIEATVGVQAGFTAKVNEFVNVKVEAGATVNKIFEMKADAYDMGKAHIGYGLFEMDETNQYHLQSNFLNISIEAGIPKTVLTGVYGYDYKETEKYYNGFSGQGIVDNQVSSGWNGNVKLKPFKAASKIVDKPSGKIGFNNEKKFYGLDVSAGARLIFGVKVQFKIGFQKK
jgi:hypothetical protein